MRPGFCLLVLCRGRDSDRRWSLGTGSGMQSAGRGTEAWASVTDAGGAARRRATGARREKTETSGGRGGGRRRPAPNPHRASARQKARPRFKAECSGSVSRPKWPREEKRWCAEASAGSQLAGRSVQTGRALISRGIHTATARCSHPVARPEGAGPAVRRGTARASVRPESAGGQAPGAGGGWGPGAGFVLSWGSRVQGHLALITHLLLSGGHVRPAWGGDSPRHTDRVTLAEAAPALPQGTAVRTEGCEGLHAFWHVVGLGQPWASLGEMA